MSSLHTENILRISLIALLFLAGIANPAVSQFHDADWLERGLLAEFRGEPEQALQIWARAREELEEPDARIGFEFIRLVTEREMETWYEQATEMYYWAISEPFAGINRAAIRQEMERLRPIVGSGIYRQWSEWFEARNRRLATDIRGFWTQMDPTPGSELNERLIEHWLRIAFARTHFDRNRRTIYGTDDRALVYIRYGFPDSRRSGVLSIDNQNMGRWISQQFETAELPADQNGQDPSFSFDLEPADRRDMFRQLEEYVFQFHQFPEYEVWTYRDSEETGRGSLIFIFGTAPGSGEFRRHSSVDDLIPDRAFLSDRRSLNLRSEFVRQGLTPALVLQMLYYERLMDVDEYFSSRLNVIRESFIDQGPLSRRSLDLALRSENRDILALRESDTPREHSTYSRMIPAIPVELHQYRLLDEMDRPKLITFLESRPGNALSQDLHSDPAREQADLSTETAGDYRLSHQLLVYDDEWNRELFFDHSPTLRFDSSDPYSTIIQSVYISEHDRQSFQSASARLIHTGPEEERERYTLLFPRELRGLGTLKNQQPPPLIAEEGRLEMADLILGFRDEELPDDYPFPFRVVNDQMIPAEESLVLHFEVYNLAPSEETGFTRFDLTYRIYPVLEDGTVLTEEEEFYLTIRFEDDQTRVIEELEILTFDLSNGLYELQVFIQDMVSGQERRRDIRFEVTD